MKLAPSQRNVELLHELEKELQKIGENAIQSASTFRSQASSCSNELTEGDEEGLNSIAESAGSEAEKMSSIAASLAQEANKLADELEEQIQKKTL